MNQRPAASSLLLLAVGALLPIGVFGADHISPAKGNDPTLYPVGSIVRLHCDGGDELKRGSIYRSPQAVWALYDLMNEPMPKASRMLPWGTRLRVVSTSRHQTNTPISHAPFINLQVLEVEPVSATHWSGYVDSILVYPDHGPKDPTSVCE